MMLAPHVYDTFLDNTLMSVKVKLYRRQETEQYRIFSISICRAKHRIFSKLLLTFYVSLWTTQPVKTKVKFEITFASWYKSLFLLENRLLLFLIIMSKRNTVMT